MLITHFYDPESSTLSYVVACQETGSCIIIDPVLDFDYASGTIHTQTADHLIAFIKESNFSLELILETHVHADHLTSAPYIRECLGGKIAIGKMITQVQTTFAEVFDEDSEFARDGSQFDQIFADGDSFQMGSIVCTAMHVPGHTPACMAYLLDDALFVGDTLFMPDAGTARCDFPGGDAHALFQSIQRLLALPEDTRIFVCHDYQPNDRKLAYETTVGEQRALNIHIGGDTQESDFVRMRETRDAELGMPALILPSLQLNMRAGLIPAAEETDRIFLKVPINRFGGISLNKLPKEKPSAQS
ncbi:MAG: MBL fold metallo-hydrolase [Luminiphilus sp.]|nr:MBL fold metallo-hydrolase [Luminiphilus sp.]